MKYRVFDKITQQDITDQYDWVITPDGELKYLVYGDLIGNPNAMYIIAEGVDALNENPKTEYRGSRAKILIIDDLCDIDKEELKEVLSGEKHGT